MALFGADNVAQALAVAVGTATVAVSLLLALVLAETLGEGDGVALRTVEAEAEGEPRLGEGVADSRGLTVGVPLLRSDSVGEMEGEGEPDRAAEVEGLGEEEREGKADTVTLGGREDVALEEVEGVAARNVSEIVALLHCVGDGVGELVPSGEVEGLVEGLCESVAATVAVPENEGEGEVEEQPLLEALGGAPVAEARLAEGEGEGEPSPLEEGVAEEHRDTRLLTDTEIDDVAEREEEEQPLLEALGGPPVAVAKLAEDEGDAVPSPLAEGVTEGRGVREWVEDATPELDGEREEEGQPLPEALGWPPVAVARLVEGEGDTEPSPLEEGVTEGLGETEWEKDAAPELEEK